MTNPRISHPQVAIGGPQTNVTSVQPALGINGFLGFLRVLEVAETEMGGMARTMPLQAMMAAGREAAYTSMNIPLKHIHAADADLATAFARHARVGDGAISSDNAQVMGIRHVVTHLRHTDEAHLAAGERSTNMTQGCLRTRVREFSQAGVVVPRGATHLISQISKAANTTTLGLAVSLSHAGSKNNTKEFHDVRGNGCTAGGNELDAVQAEAGADLQNGTKYYSESGKRMRSSSWQYLAEHQLVPEPVVQVVLLQVMHL